MNKLPIFCALTFLASVSSVFADDGLEHHPNGPDGAAIQSKDGVKSVDTQAISWDDFRGRCQHPKDYDRQVSPENISISCSAVETEFVPQAPGSFPMIASRKIKAGVFSSKWHVGGVEAMDVPVEQKNGSCLRFKEVKRTLTEARQASCGDILNIKGGIEEFCGGALEEARANHPKLVQSQDTGRLIDTCNSVTIAGGSTPTPDEGHGQ